MRFNRNTIQHNKLGDTKEVNRFAWLPTAVGREVVWLESYVTLYVYVQATVKAIINNEAGSLTYGYWQKVSAKAIKDK